MAIVGFWFTNRETKKQIIAEIDRSKRQIVLNKMEDVPWELLHTVSKMMNGVQDDKFLDLMFKIHAYGSPEAIQIASHLRRAVQNQTKDDVAEHYLVLIYTSLLCAQVKFDITGIVDCSSGWFEFMVNDIYTKPGYKKMIEVEINKAVDQINLDRQFKCKATS